MSEPINNIISPWMPEQDRHRLAVLGKLAEECNELAGRAARCIIQGLDESDPASGRTNREELAREVADVEACIATAGAALALEIDLERVNDKCAGFQRWHRLIAAGDLKSTCAQLLPGGKMDDSTYEKVEDALDRIDAPLTADDGRYLALHERIAALANLPRKGASK